MYIKESVPRGYHRTSRDLTQTIGIMRKDGRAKVIIAKTPADSETAGSVIAEEGRQNAFDR